MSHYVNPYVEHIMRLLRCSEMEAQMIERIMRDDIFHSTLDWQTREQFKRGAAQAARLLAADRAAYEREFRAGIEMFQQLRLEPEAREKAIAQQASAVPAADEWREKASSDEPEVMLDQKQTILCLVIFREHLGETIVQGCRFHLAPCADGQWFVWAEAHQPPEAPEPCDACYDFFDGIGKAFASRAEALTAIYEFGSESCCLEAVGAEPEAVALR